MMTLLLLSFLLFSQHGFSVIIPDGVISDVGQQVSQPVELNSGSWKDGAQLTKVKRISTTLSGANGCYCLNHTCACCEHLDIPKLHINDTGCVELIYLPQELGISMIFMIDDYILLNETVSVHNPPPICYAVPKFTAANICVQFYNVDIIDKTISGCLRVIAELADMEIYKRKIGCFRFPLYWG